MFNIPTQFKIRTEGYWPILFPSNDWSEVAVTPPYDLSHPSDAIYFSLGQYFFPEEILISPE